MRDYKDKSRKLARQRYWEEKDRDSYSCPDCCRSEEQVVGTFEVHHKNGEPMDNRPDNHVALCRVCHMLREGKKPSRKHIENLRSQLSDAETGDADDTGTPAVYLAGTMDEESPETQTWRSSVAERGDRGTYRYTGSTPITINSPTEVMYSHGAGPVKGVASDDMDLIEESDAIVAYFEKREQVGTLTELIYAVSRGKPALVMFDSNLVSGFTDDDSPWEDLAKGVEFHFQSHVYWFLINFLSDEGWGGLEAEVELKVVTSRDEIQEAFQDWSWHEEAVADTMSPPSSTTKQSQEWRITTTTEDGNKTGL